MNSHFALRTHKSLPQEPVSQLHPWGDNPTGKLFEQIVRLSYQGESLLVRQIVLELFQPTRHGEKQIAILTKLSSAEASAPVVTQLDLQRRSVENLFQTVTENYECEIQTLGYPSSALFSFCLALVSYNILATVRAVLASVHGFGKIEAGLSDYYMVDKILAYLSGDDDCDSFRKLECFY